MNIEFRFLQKAIQNKNYISFAYENKNHKSIKPLKLDDKNRLYSDKGIFEFEKMTKIQILKNQF
ncbi:MAG: hypothetical protein KA070_01690 [Aliarcobacter sp.]|jgi:hypothetical protein|nr:hypothetical protein [Aliarcobacter sp.]